MLPKMEAKDRHPFVGDEDDDVGQRNASVSWLGGGACSVGVLCSSRSDKWQLDDAPRHGDPFIHCYGTRASWPQETRE